MRPIAPILLLVIAASAAAQVAPLPPDPGVAAEEAGWLGVMLDTGAAGAVVTRPIPGSPAVAGGLRPGDVIVSVDGIPVGSASALVQLIGSHAAGDEVALEVAQGDTTRTVRVALAGRPDTTNVATLLVGSPFPFVPVLRIDDAAETLPTAGAPVTVVEFWATWCGPCHVAQPAMRTIRAAHADATLRIYAISSEDVASVARFVAESPNVTWDVYADPTGVAETSAFVTSLPTWFVIDADGTVVSVHSGAFGIAGVAEDVRRLAARAAVDAVPGDGVADGSGAP